MKKDNMLNESTIRRFMKLATIDGLSDKFVDEKLHESEEQELEERGMKPKRDDEEMREGEEEIEEAKDDDEMREGADEDLEEGKHDDDEMREGGRRRETRKKIWMKFPLKKKKWKWTWILIWMRKSQPLVAWFLLTS